jgi:hypothetical protein
MYVFPLPLDYCGSHDEDILATNRILSVQNAEEAAELKKKRAFRKFSYRGIDLDQSVSPILFPSSKTKQLPMNSDTSLQQTPRPLLRTAP